MLSSTKDSKAIKHLLSKQADKEYKIYRENDISSAKDIDDFLLGYAQGRLIELPNFGDGLVQGDDGNTLDFNG